MLSMRESYQSDWCARDACTTELDHAYCSSTRCESCGMSWRETADGETTSVRTKNDSRRKRSRSILRVRWQAGLRILTGCCGGSGYIDADLGERRRSMTNDHAGSVTWTTRGRSGAGIETLRHLDFRVRPRHVGDSLRRWCGQGLAAAGWRHRQRVRRAAVHGRARRCGAAGGPGVHGLEPAIPAGEEMR